MQNAGIKHLIADSDCKFHSEKTTTFLKKNFGISVWPSAAKIPWDRREGGYPVNSPDLMVGDQSIHNDFKNSRNGLYDKWNNQTRKGRHTNGRFLHLLQNCWDEMPQSHVQNSIDAQYHVIHEIIENGGKATSYMNSH